MKENKFEYWITQVDRCELDLVNPRMIYWTSLGRVTRVKMIPPSNTEDLDDMKSWNVIVFHDFNQRVDQTASRFSKWRGSLSVGTWVRSLAISPVTRVLRLSGSNTLI